MQIMTGNGLLISVFIEILNIALPKDSHEYKLSKYAL